MLGVRFLDADFMRINFAPRVSYCIGYTHFLHSRKGTSCCMERAVTAMQDGGAGAGVRHEAAARAREANLIFVLPPNLYNRPPPRGKLFGFKFSSRRHPRKFGQKRFLVLREVLARSGVACFGLPPWKKFSAA